MTFSQIIVVLVVALLVFGPRELPWRTRDPLGDPDEPVKKTFSTAFFVGVGILFGGFAIVEFFLWR